MTSVTYTAKRSLIGGHSGGSSYSLDLSVLRSTQGWTRKPTLEVNEALSGLREVIRHNAIKTMTVNLAPLAGSALAQVREFLDSVEAGESFTFDAHGTIATPNDAVTVTLQDGGYSENRIGANGQGGSSDQMAITFTVRRIG